MRRAAVLVAVGTAGLGEANAGRLRLAHADRSIAFGFQAPTIAVRHACDALGGGTLVLTPRGAARAGRTGRAAAGVCLAHCADASSATGLVAGTGGIHRRVVATALATSAAVSGFGARAFARSSGRLVARHSCARICQAGPVVTAEGARGVGRHVAAGAGRALTGCEGGSSIGVVADGCGWAVAAHQGAGVGLAGAIRATESAGGVLRHVAAVAGATGPAGGVRGQGTGVLADGWRRRRAGYGRAGVGLASAIHATEDAGGILRWVTACSCAAAAAAGVGRASARVLAASTRWGRASHAETRIRVARTRLTGAGGQVRRVLAQTLDAATDLVVSFQLRTAGATRRWRLLTTDTATRVGLASPLGTTKVTGGVDGRVTTNSSGTHAAWRVAGFDRRTLANGSWRLVASHGVTRVGLACAGVTAEAARRLVRLVTAAAGLATAQGRVRGQRARALTAGDWRRRAGQRKARINAARAIVTGALDHMRRIAAGAIHAGPCRVVRFELRRAGAVGSGRRVAGDAEARVRQRAASDPAAVRIDATRSAALRAASPALRAASPALRAAGATTTAGTGTNRLASGRASAATADGWKAPGCAGTSARPVSPPLRARAAHQTNRHYTEKLHQRHYLPISSSECCANSPA